MEHTHTRANGSFWQVYTCSDVMSAAENFWSPRCVGWHNLVSLQAELQCRAPGDRIVGLFQKYRWRENGTRSPEQFDRSKWRTWSPWWPCSLPSWFCRRQSTRQSSAQAPVEDNQPLSYQKTNLFVQVDQVLSLPFVPASWAAWAAEK